MDYSTRVNRRLIEAISQMPEEKIVGAYDRLIPGWKMFVDNYLTCYSAPKAYLKTYPEAGENHTPAGFQVRVHEVFTDPMVQAAIADKMRQMTARVEITQDKITREIALMAFGRMSDFFARDAEGQIVTDEDGMPTLDFEGLTDEQYASLTELTEERRTEGRGDNAVTIRTFKTKLGGKLTALDMLAKMQGLYAPIKHEVSGKVEHQVTAVTVNMTIEDAAKLYQYALEEQP